MDVGQFRCDKVCFAILLLARLKNLVDEQLLKLRVEFDFVVGSLLPVDIRQGPVR